MGTVFGAAVTPTVLVTAAPDVDRLARPGRHALSHVLTTLADGSPLAVPVVIVAGRQPRPRVLAVAGVHGDEMEGVVALQAIAAETDPAGLRGTLVIVPIANAPAFRAARRRSPLDDLDLNRTFPGDPAGSPSERLAYHLLHDYALGADFVLSMHSWGSRGLVIPYVEFPAGDGDIAARSLRAARALGLEWCRVSRWHPGLLVSCAVRSGVPAVETEIGGLAAQQDATHQQCRTVVDRLLHHLGLLAGDPPPAPAARVVRHREVAAPVGGVLWRCRRLGDPVTPGDVVAVVRDLHGSPLAEVTSPLESVVAAYRFCSSVNPGDPVATLFEQTAETVTGPER